jgi:hypothetical protein
LYPQYSVSSSNAPRCITELCYDETGLFFKKQPNVPKLRKSLAEAVSCYPLLSGRLEIGEIDSDDTKLDKRPGQKEAVVNCTDAGVPFAEHEFEHDAQHALTSPNWSETMMVCK